MLCCCWLGGWQAGHLVRNKSASYSLKFSSEARGGTNCGELTNGGSSYVKRSLKWRWWWVCEWTVFDSVYIRLYSAVLFAIYIFSVSLFSAMQAYFFSFVWECMCVKYSACMNLTGLIRKKMKWEILLLQPNIDIIQGTVPYLGTFLTDLMMVDTALKDLTDDGLINFDKCRKEFELMTQIRMLQLSANSYNIEPEPDFFTWFYNLRIYDDSER